MKRLFLLPQKLRWQLSLSYIMVVLVTIPTLLVIGWAVIIFTSLPPSLGLPPSEQLVQLLETHNVAMKATKVIQNHDSLQQDFDLRQILGNSNAAYVLEAAIISGTRQPLALYGRKGQFLASERVISTASLLGSQRAQTIILAAFADDQRPANLAYTFADGRTIAAIPLLNPQTTKDTPIAVFFIAVSGLPKSESSATNPLSDFFSPSDRQPNAATPVTRMVPFVLLFILVISIICITSGIVTARRITQRLQRITAAVHGWSLGNFQDTINDHTTDELGHLAQDLNQMTQQIQALLMARQQLSLLEERQRVARDLHDSVKQHTFAVGLLIGAARKALDKDIAMAHTYLAQAEDLSDQTRQELAVIIQEMHPLTLLDKGLSAVLQEYIERWSQRTAITTEVWLHPLEQALLPEIEEVLLRVTQEALANIARHSGARQVKLELIQADGQVQLSIHDNGHGFIVALAHGKGFGLSSMRERIENVQGVLNITSDASGSLIETWLPSARKHAETDKGK